MDCAVGVVAVLFLLFALIRPVFVAGVGVEKWITPVWGFGIDGTFGITNGSQYGAFQCGNWFNYVTVMPQVKVNLNNLIAGYNGEPRVIEVIPTVGFGWIHGFYKNGSSNFMVGKFGINL